MQRLPLIRLTVCLCFTVALAHAGEKPEYRTDGNPDASLSWFEPVPGEFPPEDAAHYFAGELISFDHIERTVKLRGDRQDGRAGQDEAIEIAMLPYASIYYHNTYASLRDIPIGTHLHGLFYIRPEAERFWEMRNGELQRKSGKNGNASAEVDFTRCFRLEDDFSFLARKKQVWKIEKVEGFVPENAEDRSRSVIEQRLTATLMQEGNPSGEPKVFDLMASTNVFRGNGFASLEDIRPGQLAQMNLTWVTLFGPGRVTDLWLDEESRAGASARQLRRHHRHIREHGIPGTVAAVNDRERVVTMTFFDSVDPALFKELPDTNSKPLGWPTKEYNWGNVAPKGNIIVVRECLMSYDQVNDRKGGNILNIGKVPVQPGCSGVQIQVQCGILLEGFRPKKSVRFFPATWPVVSLPKEERYHGRE